MFGTNFFLHSTKSETLEMSWHRGDGHYGPNFIHLESPCLSNSGLGCFCAVDFKVTTRKEFADYVETFGANKVPVKFKVDYADRKVVGAGLLAVGNWPKERFSESEMSLSTGFRMTVASRTKSGGRLDNPGDCFSPMGQ